MKYRRIPQFEHEDFETRTARQRMLITPVEVAQEDRDMRGPTYKAAVAAAVFATPWMPAGAFQEGKVIFEFNSELAHAVMKVLNRADGDPLVSLHEDSLWLQAFVKMDVTQAKAIVAA